LLWIAAQKKRLRRGGERLRTCSPSSTRYLDSHAKDFGNSKTKREGRTSILGHLGEAPPRPPLSLPTAYPALSGPASSRRRPPNLVGILDGPERTMGGRSRASLRLLRILPQPTMARLRRHLRGHSASSSTPADPRLMPPEDSRGRGGNYRTTTQRRSSVTESAASLRLLPRLVAHVVCV
jgi:hypothetical protein